MKIKTYLLITILFLGCSRKSTPPAQTNIGNREAQTGSVKTGFKVLDYLYAISGKKTIAGIHNREPNATPARWTNKMDSITGKYPGFWSGDFLFQKDNISNRKVMISEALHQWKLGSVVQIMWHACNPALSEPCAFNDKGVLSKLTDAQWLSLVTNGTPLNRKWKSMIDEVSVYLQFLEDNGVEVLWRPLHEMNIKAFWWSGRPGPGGTRKLYQITHDYMTKVKGLTNLIWVWDMQDTRGFQNEMKDYDPGDDYWDVAALDIYDDKTGYAAFKYNAMVKAAHGKPIAIGECQTLPSQKELEAQPEWTFFMSWSELTLQHNSLQNIKALYHSPNVITRDEMPGWK